MSRPRYSLLFSPFNAEHRDPKARKKILVAVEKAERENCDVEKAAIQKNRALNIMMKHWLRED